MRNSPHLPVAIPDPALNRFLTSVQACLASVVDLILYEDTVVWKPPYRLFIPLRNAQTRPVQPKIVELGRAVVINEPETPVHFGATTWRWDSTNQITIIDQAGLVEGVRYSLVYKVIG
jgi:hypothetical protein